ncbi:MAG TPA: CHAT domain-containing tetratricopeptide repeat protein [Chthonomonadaceae bacterium]|nr:CHAT domain-containing tetratricopeptide repeat protein [Chthonomonadaceae bacterium]
MAARGALSSFLRWVILGISVAVLQAPLRTRAQVPASVAPGKQEMPARPSALEQEFNRLEKEGSRADDNYDYPAAERAYQAGLKLSQANRDTCRTASFLMRLGGVYVDIDQYDRALDCFARAVTLLERSDKPQDTARCLNGLGAVYGNLGQYERAADYFRRELTIEKSLGDDRGVVVCLSNLGAICGRLNRHEKALDYLTSALQIAEKVGDPRLIAKTLINQGDAYDHTSQFSKAVACYDRSLALLEKLPNRFDLALCLDNIGGIYQERGLFDKAIEYRRRALEIYRALKSRLYAISCLNHLAEIYFLQLKFEKAEEVADEACRDYEAMSAQVVDPSQLGAFLDVVEHAYARYAYLLMWRKRPEDALVMLERGRGRGLAVLAHQGHAGLEALLSSEEAARLRAATAELNRASNRWRAASLQSIPQEQTSRQAFLAQVSTARAAYDEAERRLTLLRDTLLLNHPTYGRLQGARPPTFAELRRLARQHPDTLYLEWGIVHTSATLLCALSQQDGLRTFTLHIGDEGLSKQVQRWRQALLAQQPEEPEYANALYTALFDPLEQAGLLRPGRYRRLVLVADGLLQDVPFAALRDASGKRLVERFSLSSAISLGMLTWPQNRSRPTGTLLCAADPTDARGVVLQSRTRGGLGRLPRARAEGEQVVRLFPGAVGLVGSRAREAVIKRQMGRYALLHFATHGVLDTVNGLRSGLVLAPEPSGSAEDGILEAREIMEMRLAAQLAVLSACETAQGQQSGGEGLLGLAWAFRAAGCPAVVASQWSVEDGATERLMVVFYRQLRAGKPKDEAVRQAMLAIKKERGRAAPFYWAAFQVIGDTSRLVLPHAAYRQ